MSRRRIVTRWAVVLHRPDGDWDADGGYLTAEDAREVIPYLAESHGWPVENMSVVPRETEVTR